VTIANLNTLLTQSPHIRHGKPCIAGTGITVHRIAILYTLGNSAEDIYRKYPHLPLPGIYAALAYYHANRAQIDAEIEAEAAEAKRLEEESMQSQHVP
jgi:uncharacterized protein (DUF433 family)